MNRSEESITRMTSYRLPHYGSSPSRSLWMTLNVPLTMTSFPPIVILNGVKNALWERRKMETWHGVKNLLCWWHLTGFLTMVIDPSRSFRMTS